MKKSAIDQDEYREIDLIMEEEKEMNQKATKKMSKILMIMKEVKMKVMPIHSAQAVEI
ncbi:MAG: hypothetical protein IPK55_11790 [Streptococcus sp.]|nr:hypothetical protein [Streptococcus sp.]